MSKNGVSKFPVTTSTYEAGSGGIVPSNRLRLTFDRKNGADLFIKQLRADFNSSQQTIVCTLYLTVPAKTEANWGGMIYMTSITLKWRF